jgi:protein Tex
MQRQSIKINAANCAGKHLTKKLNKIVIMPCTKDLLLCITFFYHISGIAVLIKYICSPKNNYTKMDAKYLQHIAASGNYKINSVTNIKNLVVEGATIPFISRYRKEATGNLDEVAVGDIVTKLKEAEEIIKRKETIIDTIDKLGKLTPELKTKIDECMELAVLEDIYLPYKPKRKTKAMAAKEKGLEPLALSILTQNIDFTEAIANEYITEQVPTSKEAVQGAKDIIAEIVAEDEACRAAIRSLFANDALLVSKAIASKKDEPDAQKYRDYFEFSEPLTKSPSHRILAIRRGEKEGYLAMDITINAEEAIDKLKEKYIKNNSWAAQQVTEAIEDGYKRLLKPGIETEFRLSSKTMADTEAIKVFADNVRELLLAAPLGSKRVMALDPGFRTGCKLVCLDENGNLLENTTIYPHEPQKQVFEAKETILHLVHKYKIDAIGYGNGTASRETDLFLREINFESAVNIFQVNESGASIYSASEVAREEFPDHDVTVRGSVSIGRRLLDPLSELVKIDPKSIGVGQYQHDVNQNQLKESLDRVVESAVNYVGVDVNTASHHLLSYVSGLSKNLAKNIVKFRAENGAFESRSKLLKVSMMGPKAYEQCAGFLRIRNAANPLDNSGVHPESYSLVEKMAKDLQVDVTTLIANKELQKQINPKNYITETIGEYTITDILKELEKPGRDPRAAVEVFNFEASIKTINDVKPGMQVPGIVTNVTQFGAFVDIGVKQDGLVHVSHLANRFISDPNQVVKVSQKVVVTVLEVDVARKRISLSMKDATAQAPSAQKPKGNFTKPQATQKQAPTTALAEGLAKLKMKF